MDDTFVTGPFTEEDVKKAAYGGERYIFNERRFTSSTANMLFYRRKSPANIMVIDDRLIPQFSLPPPRQGLMQVPSSLFSHALASWRPTWP